MSEIPFEDGMYVGEVREVKEGDEVFHDMHGKGKFTYFNDDVYEGEFFENEMHGKGLYTWSDGTKYEGEYVIGQQQGRGVFTGSDRYEGEWMNDVRCGRGATSYSDGSKYDGEWENDCRHGKGRMDSAEGWFYEGEWLADKQHGKGLFHQSNNDVYDGEFKNGTPDGEGTYKWSDGSTFTGSFVQGLKHGNGCERRPNGDWRAGLWANNEPDSSQTFHRAEKTDADVESLERLVDSLKIVNVPIRKADTEVAASISQSRPAASQESSVLVAHANPSPVMLADSDFNGWQKLKMLGKGSFGAVYEAVLPNGRTVCCKIVELGQMVEHEDVEKLHNEIALMKRLNDRNIVQYYGSLEDKVNNTLNIFMEYVTGGSLNHYIKKFKSLPLETIRQWTYQMVCGVKYLHDQGIVHRDIKGDNILVTMDGILKLADFGCSKAIDDVCSKTHGCKTMVGTPYWMAPEVIMCDNQGSGYGMKSDIWSVGCTIVEMITGKPPWPECNSMWAAVYKIANSKGLPSEIPTNLDPALMEFLELTFERDPAKRVSAVDLLSHRFLTN